MLLIVYASNIIVPIPMHTSAAGLSKQWLNFLNPLSVDLIALISDISIDLDLLLLLFRKIEKYGKCKIFLRYEHRHINKIASKIDQMSVIFFFFLISK